MKFLPGKGLSTSVIIMAMRASVMACRFGLVLFIGRYFDLTSLGLYGLAAGAVAIAPYVVSLGLVHLVMRDAVTLSAGKLTQALVRYWLIAISAYIVMLAVAASSMTWGGSSLWTIVVAIMLLEHFGNDAFLLFSNLNRSLLANATAFLRGAAWILAYIPLAFWIPDLRSLPAVLLFWLTGSALSFALFAWGTRTWPWAAAFAEPFQWDWIRKALPRALVLYVSDLTFVGSQYVDRYIVTLFLGLELAGVYFLCWTVANSASTFVSMTVFQQQRPILIKAYHDGGAAAHRQLTRKFMWTTALWVSALGIIAGVAFQLLLPYLNQPAASGHFAAFWLIMAGMAVRNIADCGAMALYTAQLDRLMTLTNVVSVIALVLAQIILLPLAGLAGAGLAMLAGAGLAILATFSVISYWRFRLLFSGSASR